MSDRIEMTDGRHIRSVPTSAQHAMSALGWKPVEAEKPKRTTARKK